MLDDRSRMSWYRVAARRFLLALLIAAIPVTFTACGEENDDDAEEELESMAIPHRGTQVALSTQMWTPS